MTVSNVVNIPSATAFYRIDILPTLDVFPINQTA